MYVERLEAYMGSTLAIGHSSSARGGRGPFAQGEVQRVESCYSLVVAKHWRH